MYYTLTTFITSILQNGNSSVVELKVPLCCDNCEKKVRTAMGRMEGEFNFFSIHQVTFKELICCYRNDQISNLHLINPLMSTCYMRSGTSLSCSPSSISVRRVFNSSKFWRFVALFIHILKQVCNSCRCEGRPVWSMEQEGDSGRQCPRWQCSQENAASEVRRWALAVIEEGLESSSSNFKIMMSILAHSCTYQFCHRHRSFSMPDRCFVAPDMRRRFLNLCRERRDDYSSNYSLTFLPSYKLSSTYKLYINL